VHSNVYSLSLSIYIYIFISNMQSIASLSHTHTNTPLTYTLLLPLLLSLFLALSHAFSLRLNRAIERLMDLLSISPDFSLISLLLSFSPYSLSLSLYVASGDRLCHSLNCTIECASDRLSLTRTHKYTSLTHSRSPSLSLCHAHTRFHALSLFPFETRD